MKNILIISPIMPPEIGGPASYVPEIIARLPKNFRFRVITFTPNSTLIDNVPITQVSQDGGRLVRQAKLAWEIFRNSFWADLVFVQEPLVAGVAAGIVSLLVSKPMIIKFVGYQPWEEMLAEGQTEKFLDQFLDHPDGGAKSKIYIFLTEFAFKMAKRIITPSKYLATVLKTHFGIEKKKIVTIHNAFEAPRTPTKRKPEAMKTAIYLGRLVYRKRVDWAIRAVAMINKKKRIFPRLIIVGDGPDRERLEKLADRLTTKYKIKPFVDFVGQKSREHSLAILARCDVFVLTSIYEGLPNSILESFAVGIPVVATNVPGTSEVAIHNKTALTTKPGDITALSCNIEKMLTNTALAHKLSVGGKNLLKKNFSWGVAIGKLKKVLEYRL